MSGAGYAARAGRHDRGTGAEAPADTAPLAEAPVAEPVPVPEPEAEEPAPEPKPKPAPAAATEPEAAVCSIDCSQYWWAAGRARSACAGVACSIRAQAREQAEGAGHVRRGDSGRDLRDSRSCVRSRSAPREADILVEEKRPVEVPPTAGRAAVAGARTPAESRADTQARLDRRHAVGRFARKPRGGRSAGRSRLPHGLRPVRPGRRSRPARDQARARASRSAAQAARDLSSSGATGTGSSRSPAR